jgi:alpha-aminoadipate carrier protein LysW
MSPIPIQPDTQPTGTHSAGARCPECTANTEIGSEETLGSLVTCTRCGADLQIVALNPPTLLVAPDWTECIIRRGGPWRGRHM